MSTHKIEIEYDLKIYTNRFGHDDYYKISFSDSGWDIRDRGESKPNGEGSLLERFEQDDVRYPFHFGDFLEFLWKEIKNENIRPEEVQEKLDELSEWVKICEQSVPRWKSYNR